MNFDEYAEHIYQKHRLFTAIAILKTKPAEITTTEFIQQLKSKMADDDVSICSEDFIMDYDDDDSVTILEGFEMAHDQMSQGNNAEQPKPAISENISQTTYYSSSDTIKSHKTATNNSTYYDNSGNTTDYNKGALPKTVQESNNTSRHRDANKNGVTKSKAIKESISKIDLNNKMNGKNNVSNTETNKDMTENIILNRDTNMNSNNIENNSDFRQAFNTKIADVNSTLIGLDQTNMTVDSQKTILYTVNGFTQNYTHYSQSQNQISVPENYLYRSKTDVVATNLNKTVKITDINEINRDLNTVNKDISESAYSKNISDDSSKNTVLDETIMPIDGSLENFVENIQTNIYSQEFDDILSLNQNTGAFCTFETNNDKSNEIDSYNAKNIQNTQDLHKNLDVIQYFNKENHIENTQNQQETHLSTRKSYEFSQNPTNLSQNDTQIQYFDENYPKNDSNNQNLRHLSQNFGPSIDTAAELDIIEEDKIEEVIPYKVLEELNKVKMFLTRRDRRLSTDGYSTDSGYRSDSQRSSNRSALQLSGISINQSAYCLFNHIMRCSLIHATREITTEIAQVLGKLIDKLHDEENYPPFLEELLDSTDIILRQIFKGVSFDENEFMKKEDFTQRLLLLNKSIHIQEHTIEKITNILTSFYQKVTDKNVTYELSNIDEIENICHIFHILELLIKNYAQFKNINSSNTQPSQERILKKSSLTEIWRKKWNPNLKVSEGSRENRCVLKNCSEILNKIVVECVSLYSVVAYAALKCFNCIQS